MTSAKDCPLELRLASSLLAASVLAACGGAASVAPAAPGQASYATPEAAQADLDRAERQVALALGPGATLAGNAAAVAPPAAAPAAPSAPSPVITSAERSTAGADSTSKKADAREEDEATGCRAACRAFASMQRAADAVCRLTGDADERCKSARSRVEASASRVSACGCQG